MEEDFHNHRNWYLLRKTNEEAFRTESDVEIPEDASFSEDTTAEHRPQRTANRSRKVFYLHSYLGDIIPEIVQCYLFLIIFFKEM